MQGKTDEKATLDTKAYGLRHILYVTNSVLLLKIILEISKSHTSVVI